MGDAIARFETKITEGPGGCWLWIANKTLSGYGMFQHNGSNRAHRWSYEYHIGPVPDGLELDHVCRNRACVNPWHLDPVTHQVNIARGRSGRFQAEKSACPQGHEYTPENTYVPPKGGRDCRACRAEACRRYRARKRGTNSG